MSIATRTLVSRLSTALVNARRTAAQANRLGVSSARYSARVSQLEGRLVGTLGLAFGV